MFRTIPLALLIALLAGCGSPEEAIKDASAYAGKYRTIVEPLPSKQRTFLMVSVVNNGQFCELEIKPDGTYIVMMAKGGMSGGAAEADRGVIVKRGEGFGFKSTTNKMDVGSNQTPYTVVSACTMVKVNDRRFRWVSENEDQFIIERM